MSALPDAPPAAAAAVTLTARTEDTEVSFEEFLELEDEERLFELVDGHLKERGMGIYESVLAARITHALMKHLDETGLGGYVLDADAIYRCFESEKTGRKPDVSYVAAGRLTPESLREAYFRVPPDLAVEVMSPTDRGRTVRDKERQYLAAGVRLVWRVNPDSREVFAFDAAGGVELVPADGVLSGGDVLPGLKLVVASLFED